MKTNDGGFTRIIRWEAAYDERGRGCGVHGVNLRFVLVGPKGATQLLIFTNWHLRHVRDERRRSKLPAVLGQPMAADLGHHARVPQYDGHEPHSGEPCEYLDASCYYDGSGLNADPVFDEFVASGDEEVVWRALRDEHDRLVDG